MLIVAVLKFPIQLQTPFKEGWETLVLYYWSSDAI